MLTILSVFFNLVIWIVISILTIPLRLLIILPYVALRSVFGSSPYWVNFISLYKKHTKFLLLNALYLDSSNHDDRGEKKKPSKK